MIKKTRLSTTTSIVASIAIMAAIGGIGQQQAALAQGLDVIQLLEEIGDEIEDRPCLSGLPMEFGLCPEDFRDFYDAALCSRAAEDPRLERFC